MAFDCTARRSARKCILHPIILIWNSRAVCRGWRLDLCLTTCVSIKESSNSNGIIIDMIILALGRHLTGIWDNINASIQDDQGVAAGGSDVYLRWPRAETSLYGLLITCAILERSSVTMMLWMTSYMYTLFLVESFL